MDDTAKRGSREAVISLRVNQDLQERLKRKARSSSQSQSDIVRQALESFLLADDRSEADFLLQSESGRGPTGSIDIEHEIELTRQRSEELHQLAYFRRDELNKIEQALADADRERAEIMARYGQLREQRDMAAKELQRLTADVAVLDHRLGMMTALPGSGPDMATERWVAEVKSMRERRPAEPRAQRKAPRKEEG